MTLSIVELDRKSAFDPTMWVERARGGKSGGYEKLGWVGNDGLLKPFIDLGNFRGDETVVDVGTGSLAVLRTVAPHVGEIIGFDIASAMIKRGDEDLPSNAGVFVGDAYKIPLQDGSVDVVTTRMVYHHLPDVADAVVEAARILRPGGKLIVSEYVAPDPSTLEFDNVAFQIKEAGRHLWTGDQLNKLIAGAGDSFRSAELYFAMLPQYSVRDWVGKSGISVEKQMKITDHYRAAPDFARRSMNIQNVSEDSDPDRDVLVDRPFAFVVAIRN